MNHVCGHLAGIWTSGDEPRIKKSLCPNCLSKMKAIQEKERALRESIVQKLESKGVLQFDDAERKLIIEKLRWIAI